MVCPIQLSPPSLLLRDSIFFPIYRSYSDLVIVSTFMVKIKLEHALYSDIVTLNLFKSKMMTHFF